MDEVPICSCITKVIVVTKCPTTFSDNIHPIFNMPTCLPLTTIVELKYSPKSAVHLGNCACA
jgi:hypothetical protein